MNYPPGYPPPPPGYPAQPGWPAPQVLQPGMVPQGAQPAAPAWPQQPQQMPPQMPPPGGVGAYPPGYPPQPVYQAPTTLAQYTKPDEAAIQTAYQKAAAEQAARSSFGGPRPTFLKIPGPQGQTKWDRTVPVGYENFVIVWFLWPWRQGVGLSIEQATHFFRSSAHPNGMSIEHAEGACGFCDACTAAKGLTMYPDLQKRAVDWGKIGRKHLYNIINLSMIPAHYGQDGVPRPMVLPAGAYLHTAIGELIKGLGGATNLVDPYVGRPVKITKKKTGASDMDVDYTAQPANFNGPQPLPAEAYPMTHNLWDLEKLIFRPSPEQVAKAIQECGLAPPTQAFNPQAAPPYPSPYQPQGAPQMQLPFAPPQQGPPPPPIWTPPSPQYAPAQAPQGQWPGWTPPPAQPPQMAPPPMAAPQQGPGGYPMPAPVPQGPPAMAPPPPMMQPPPPYQGPPAGPPQAPQQAPQMAPPPLSSVPGAPPYMPQPSQGPTSVPPPVATAHPGAQAPQGQAGFALRFPLDPSIKLPESREMCFSRPNEADRLCRECPAWIKSQCLTAAQQAGATVAAPSQAPAPTPQSQAASLEALQRQLAGG